MSNDLFVFLFCDLKKCEIVVTQETKRPYNFFLKHKA